MLESKMAPVLSDQGVEIDDGNRTPRQTCWTWHWVKNRYAQQIVVSWTIAV